MATAGGRWTSSERSWVSVDGETVYDKTDDQYEVDDIVREVRQRL